MTETRSLLEQLLWNLKEAAALEVSRGQLHAETESLIEQLKKEISSGESTGDNIIDVVLLAERTPTSETLGRYRRIEEALSGKQGQLVLVPYFEDRWERSDRTHETEPYPKYAVGRLEEEQLRHSSERRSVGLPTPFYATMEPPTYFRSKKFREVRKHEGYLTERIEASIFSYFIVPGDDPVPTTGFFTTVRSSPIYLGDDAVRRFIAKEFGMQIELGKTSVEDIFNELAGHAGRLTLTPPS